MDFFSDLLKALLVLHTHDSTSYLEQNDPEKELKQRSVALNNLLIAKFLSVKSLLLAHPTLWF